MTSAVLDSAVGPGVSCGELVLVWRVSLDLAPARLAAMMQLLDPTEQARASRFRSETDCSRFVAAHGWLRIILGQCTGMAPADLPLRAGPAGKPQLAGSVSPTDVRFNLAHSGPLALVAVAVGREVGVDVEQIRPEVECDAIAARFYSPAEREVLRRAPPATRAEVFFRIWVRKEALLKAVGTGIGDDLAELDLSVLSESRVSMGAGAQARVWTVRELPLEAGFAVAVAAEGEGWEIRRQQAD